MRPGPPQGMPLCPLHGRVVVRYMRLVNADPLPVEVDHPAVVDALAELEERDRAGRTDQPARP